MSRPARPKPFLPLIGPLTSFQETALRVAPLARGGTLVVVGGQGHGDLIRTQLAAVGIEAQVLLEPVPRDTTAAIAVASAWVARIDPRAIVAVVSADHHVPDAIAFRVAVEECLTRALAGDIVTLGVRPTTASTAYGYIRPGPGPDAVRPIAGFEEKPDSRRAAALIEAGALWNSGTFVATAGTLVGALRRWAADVHDAATAALEAAVTGVDGLRLGAGFAASPRIAFDRAVMETTDRGAVLPVDFAWSDLGSWDMVLEASVADAEGNSLSSGARVSGGTEILVRATPGIQVSVVGASRLAVVAEPGAVLVCALDQAQAVQPMAAAERPRFATLGAAAEWYDLWLRTAALPLWATVGTDRLTGGFRDALSWTGQPVDPHRRTRVQARQAFVFSSAQSDGFAGPWGAVADAGFATFLSQAQRPDGLFATTVDLAGIQTDATPRLYEQAFVLLALSSRHQCEAGVVHAEQAVALRQRLDGFRHRAGGFREAGAEPFQANAQMHLLEAALAWEGLDDDAGWTSLADELVELALTRFIDPATGALSEFFEADWGRLDGAAGLIEPGHQFEWAWLLARWGAARRDPRGECAARRLFEVGRRGFVADRGVVVNALQDDLSIRDAGARLWPQTEHLKAALILGETAAALQAANGLAVYLDTPARGVWRERMRADGGFVLEPSPATSLYHLYLAARALD